MYISIVGNIEFQSGSMNPLTVPAGETVEFSHYPAEGLQLVSFGWTSAVPELNIASALVQYDPTNIRGWFKATVENTDLSSNHILRFSYTAIKIAS